MYLTYLGVTAMDWVKNLFIDSAYKTVLFTLEEENKLIDIKNDSGHKL